MGNVKGGVEANLIEKELTQTTSMSTNENLFSFLVCMPSQGNVYKRHWKLWMERLCVGYTHTLPEGAWCRNSDYA